MAAWVFGSAGLHGGQNLEMWGRFTFASASPMPAAFLAFTQCYPCLLYTSDAADDTT